MSLGTRRPQPEPFETIPSYLARLEAWNEQGNWTPASGGTETSFTTRTGRRLLYVYQARTGRHAYLDVQTDLILTDEEARQALETY
jgi:hypothetical protein